MFSLKATIQTDKRKSRMKDHIESLHLLNQVHQCKLCLKVYATKNSLYAHNSRCPNRNNLQFT